MVFWNERRTIQNTNVVVLFCHFLLVLSFSSLHKTSTFLHFYSSGTRTDWLTDGLTLRLCYRLPIWYRFFTRTDHVTESKTLWCFNKCSKENLCRMSKQRKTLTRSKSQASVMSSISAVIGMTTGQSIIPLTMPNVPIANDTTQYRSSIQWQYIKSTFI